jgi:hypothetical protein
MYETTWGLATGLSRERGEKTNGEVFLEHKSAEDFTRFAFSILYDPGPKKLLQKQNIVEHVLHQQALLCYLSADNDQANRSNLFS